MQKHSLYLVRPRPPKDKFPFQAYEQSIHIFIPLLIFSDLNCFIVSSDLSHVATDPNQPESDD